MIINLTPHPIAIYANDCPDRIDPAQVEPLFRVGVKPGSPARIAETTLGTWFTDAFDEEGVSPEVSLSR